MTKRKLQIGVMGSAADLNYAQSAQEKAEKIGELIAKSGNTLVFGAEKDCDSLSTRAAVSAKKYGGLTVGVTYGKEKKIWENASADVLVVSGLERGGGREFVLVNSCDGIICLSGGSGTMNEMLIAYQLNIPIVVIRGEGGWCDIMANKYFDERKRIKAIATLSPEEAVETMIKIIEKYEK